MITNFGNEYSSKPRRSQSAYINEVKKGKKLSTYHSESSFQCIECLYTTGRTTHGGEWGYLPLLSSSGDALPWTPSRWWTASVRSEFRPVTLTGYRCGSVRETVVELDSPSMETLVSHEVGRSGNDRRVPTLKRHSTAVPSPWKAAGTDLTCGNEQTSAAHDLQYLRGVNNALSGKYRPANEVGRGSSPSNGSCLNVGEVSNVMELAVERGYNWITRERHAYVWCVCTAPEWMLRAKVEPPGQSEFRFSADRLLIVACLQKKQKSPQGSRRKDLKTVAEISASGLHNCELNDAKSTAGHETTPVIKRFRRLKHFPKVQQSARRTNHSSEIWVMRVRIASNTSVICEFAALSNPFFNPISFV